MGIDFVDIIFRCERVFKIKLDRQAFEQNLIDWNMAHPERLRADLQVRDLAGC